MPLKDTSINYGATTNPKRSATIGEVEALIAQSQADVEADLSLAIANINEVSVEIGDKQTLPEWLQGSIRDVSKQHDDYLRQFAINVKQPPYNAKGDNVDDKTPISTVLSSNGDIVLYLPRGTYNLPNWVSLTLNKSVTIIGEDRNNTFIKGISTQDFIKSNNSIKLINITFDTWNNVINLDNFTGTIENLTLKNCSFKNLAGCSVRGSIVPDNSKINNIVIYNNIITNCGRNGINLSALYENAQITYNKISNVNTVGTSAAGIRLGDDTSTKQMGYKRAIIEHNIIKNITNNGDYECQGILLYSSYGVIDKNYVEDVSNTAGTSCEGIYSKSLFGIVSNNTLVNAGRYEASINIKGYPRIETEPTVGHRGYGQSCYGNKVFCTITDKELNGISTMAEDIKIYDNHIEGFTGSGIKVVAKNDKHNISIKDNILKNGKGMYGISLDGSSVKRMIIEDNIIDGLTGEFGVTSVYGINIMNNHTTSIEDISIEGNVIKNLFQQSGKVTADLNINNNTIATMKGISIKNNTFGDATRGIIWTNPNNNISGVKIEDNTFGTFSAYVTYQPPADTIIKNNSGYRTENRGFSTLPAGTTTLVVNHGLGIPPTVNDIFLSQVSQVDPTNNFRVSAVSSTTFTIALNSSQATDVVLNWQAFSPFSR